jgi:ubiquinone/menaquinone biosynthesis C-methylase UbiE
MIGPFDDPGFWNSFAGHDHSKAGSFTVPFAERAYAEAALPKGSRVLDIATGIGALAIVAARAGARVLATDFADGMVQRVLSFGLPNIEARTMDGQALDLPDGSFDAAFSMFGVMLFPDWRAGLSEMARVVRPGGVGCIGTWKHPRGAAATLLLSQTCARLFPEIDSPEPWGGLVELSDPDRLRVAMQGVGFSDVRIVEETRDFVVTTAMLAEPDELFRFSPLWPLLGQVQRDRVLEVMRAPGGDVVVPSTASIATGLRR